jgi:hypothetical protein
LITEVDPKDGMLVPADLVEEVQDGKCHLETVVVGKLNFRQSQEEDQKDGHQHHHLHLKQDGHQEVPPKAGHQEVHPRAGQVEEALNPSQSQYD